MELWAIRRWTFKLRANLAANSTADDLATMTQMHESPARTACIHQAARASRVPVTDRTPAFACANLRDSFNISTRGNIPMVKASRRTRATNPVSSNASDLAPPASFFLRTKLLPPRPAPEMLSRPRLVERLHANLALPVTLVTANAGSGKTTLVADFLRKQEQPYVWYQLDHTDADPSVFLGYLAHGIQQQVAGFGDKMFAYLQQTGELAQQPERAVDVLLNEILEGVEQKLVIVLDDYHHLGADTPVHAVVDRLIAYLPEVIHVIIISRDIPRLTLARLRSQDSLAILDRTDLLFTAEETQELLRKVFGLELTSEQLREYGERTHGWITALQLVRQVAQRQLASGSDQKKAKDPLAVLHQSERDIFEYFAEEVLAAEAPEMRQFLTGIALLDRIEVETCARLYPQVKSATALTALVRGNVFMTVASDSRGEEFRLHPLFQSFLRRRLRTEVGPAGVIAEHARCAQYFLEQGAWEQAVSHLLQAEDYERAAEIIARHGAGWITSGKLGLLVSLAQALPAAALEAHPQVLASRAEVARLRGELDAAESLFRRATAALHEKGDREGEAEALHSQATIARRRGDYESAFSYLDRALGLTEPESVVRMKCSNTRGLCLVSRGEWAAAEREFRAALQSAEERNDVHYARLITHNLGLPSMARGDFGEALRWLRRMLRTDTGQPSIPQETTAHLNIARCHLYRGEMDDCEEHLDAALERCQLFNLVGQRAETFETYGNLCRERGEHSRATEFYERAMRSYEEAGIDVARVELLEEQAFLSLKAGDVARARAQIDRLGDLRQKSNDDLGHFPTTLARGRIMLAQHKYDDASEQLTPALDYFHQHGLYYYEAQACMALAICDQESSREPQMIEHLRRALDLAARFDYEYWLRQEIRHRPGLFVTEDVFELLPPDLREQVAVWLQHPAEPATQPVAALNVRPLVDLTINMLGPVEIVRDPARPLAGDAWTTRRARDIFCFIASRPHRRTPKDTIIDTFWAEADLDIVEKNFHPTVSHIRKALNSNQPLKQNFLVYRDGDYQLNPEFSYRIETEEFDRLINDGETARRERNFDRCIDCYEQAVALYRGEFMQGSYEPWVEEQRTYYREQYLRMLESLAAVAEKKEEWTRAMDLAQRIIREDAFREDIHCLVMRAHAALGNRKAVKEQYDDLRELLQRELGVEPATQTQQTYRDLIGERKSS
jgi:ATP/maltotriose-dependent transcriptional regulator MalT/DNA-binding SARP family transcriptional activator